MNVESAVWSDTRFRILTRKAGWTNLYETVGRMALLWQQCTDLETDTLNPSIIAAVFDLDEGPATEALIASGLGEATEGPEIRVKGCAGRTDWLAKVRAGSKKGGEATRKRWESIRKEPRAMPEAVPPASSPTPALAPTPDPTSKSVPTKNRVFGGRRGRLIKGIPIDEVRPVAVRVIETFNKGFRRNISPDNWLDPIANVLSRGGTQQQMQAVIWWAAEEWGDDEERRSSISPTSLFKFQSSRQYRTFPQYLDLAGELWRKTRGGDPPWTKKD